MVDAAKLGASFIIVTHDMELAARAQRVLRLVDGVLGCAFPTPA